MKTGIQITFDLLDTTQIIETQKSRILRVGIVAVPAWCGGIQIAKDGEAVHVPRDAESWGYKFLRRVLECDELPRCGERHPSMPEFELVSRRLVPDIVGVRGVLTYRAVKETA